MFRRNDFLLLLVFLTESLSGSLRKKKSIRHEKETFQFFPHPLPPLWREKEKKNKENIVTLIL